MSNAKIYGIKGLELQRNLWYIAVTLKLHWLKSNLTRIKVWIRLDLTIKQVVQ